MTDRRETVWFTVKEYAQTRKLSESTVRRMMKAGDLTVEHLGRRCVRIRFTRVVRSSQEPSAQP